MTYDIQYKKDTDIPKEFKGLLVESLKLCEDTTIRIQLFVFLKILRS